MRYDYHNAKTIVKAEAVGIDPAPLLSGAGRATQALKTAYETGESKRPSRFWRRPRDYRFPRNADPQRAI